MDCLPSTLTQQLMPLETLVFLTHLPFVRNRRRRMSTIDSALWSLSVMLRSRTWRQSKAHSALFMSEGLEKKDLPLPTYGNGSVTQYGLVVQILRAAQVPNWRSSHQKGTSRHFLPVFANLTWTLSAGQLHKGLWRSLALLYWELNLLMRWRRPHAHTTTNSLAVTPGLDLQFNVKTSAWHLPIT